MSNRIKCIDMAKCFSITMIVLGHTLNHSIHLQLVGKFLYNFHVVFFFILSGYTFKFKNEEKIVDFAKKIIRVMVPYLI